MSKHFENHSEDRIVTDSQVGVCPSQTNPLLKKGHNYLKKQRQRSARRAAGHNKAQRTHSRQETHPRRRTRKSVQQTKLEESKPKPAEAGAFPNDYGLVSHKVVYTMKLTQLLRQEKKRVNEDAARQEAFDFANAAMDVTDSAEHRELSGEILVFIQKSRDELNLDLDHLRMVLKAALAGFGPYLDGLNKTDFATVYVAYSAWEERKFQGKSFTGWLQRQRENKQHEQLYLKAREQRQRGECRRLNDNSTDQLAAAEMLLAKGRAEREQAAAAKAALDQSAADATAELKAELARLRAKLEQQSSESKDQLLDMACQKEFAALQARKYEKVCKELDEIRKANGDSFLKYSDDEEEELDFGELEE